MILSASYLEMETYQFLRYPELRSDVPFSDAPTPPAPMKWRHVYLFVCTAEHQRRTVASLSGSWFFFSSFLMLALARQMQRPLS